MPLHYTFDTMCELNTEHFPMNIDQLLNNSRENKKKKTEEKCLRIMKNDDSVPFFFYEICVISLSILFYCYEVCLSIELNLTSVNCYV